MKKTWTLILTMLLMLALCASAFAADSDFKHMPDYFAVGKYSGSGATEIVVPAKLNGQDTPVFYGESLSSSAMKGVTTLTISEGITQLRDMNISNADNLTKVSLPKTLETIGRRNFYQTEALTEVTIPAAVSYIGQDCFRYCDSLKKVTFRGVCPVFGADCFKDAPADLVILVPSNQVKAYKAALPEGLTIKSSGKEATVYRSKISEKDFTFDKETATITGYTGKVGCITIPSKIGGVKVKAIGKSAFFKNPFVVMVTFPEGIEVIETSAFAGSTGLARLNFPSTLKQIGKTAFNGLRLDSLVLPEGLEAIGDSAFSTTFGLNKIPEIVIPNTVTTIGSKAFFSCKAERIVIGENVQTIGSEAFAQSNKLKEIVVLNKEKIAIAGDAFSKCTEPATLTLPDGISQSVYNEYVSLMPVIFPTCTVIEPANMEMGFPALDLMAGMPFFGTWHSVAAFDGTDYYAAETFGLLMDAVLNPDGTGALTMDGDGATGCWYVQDGAAIFAPILEDGGKPVLEEAATYTLDENGRMIIDFGGIFVLFEKEGAAYHTPAIPEKPWPELNADNMKYFIGKWEAASYTMDGETHDAQAVGPMMLILNEDGTAQAIEAGEEPYDLRWAAEYAVAYVGETMNTAAKLTFDGTGNIEMNQDGTIIVLEPYVEPTPEPTPVPTPEPVDTSALLGHWDDGYKTLDVYEDGRLDLTYKSDGYVNAMEWAVVNGKPTVTKGMWKDCPMVIENGLLIISNDNGVYQEYERAEAAAEDDGDDYAEEVAALAVPVGEAGAPFIGTWVPVEMIMDGQTINVALLGMMMEITFNEDGTVAMTEDGESELGLWTVQDGKAVIDTMACTVNEKGQLVMEDAEVIMILEKGAVAESVSEEEALLALLAMVGDMAEYGMNTSDSAVAEHLQGYLGEWHMVYMNFGGMSGHPKTLLGLDSKFTVNEDGTASVGFPIDKSGNWYEEDGNVYFGEEGMPLTLLSDGCLQYGSQLGGYFVFSKDANATWEPTAGQAMTLAPGMSNIPGATAQAQSAGFATMEDRLEKKFVAKSYTSFGQTMDASMLGAEYAVVFHANGLADFTLAGMTVQSLPWGLQKVAIGLNSVDAFAINYYGSMFNAVLTDSGFDMDYYGTMTLHFVLAE